MNTSRIVSRSLIVLSMLIAFTGISRAQHTVLFETFTNSYDLCPLGNTFDQQFKQAISSAGSKVIHLNHHIGNLGDPMAQSATGSNQTGARLAGSDSAVFYAAVDRVIFTSTGSRASASLSDWDQEINAQASKSAPATISLSNITYDPTLNVLHAFVTVTASTDISDTIYIHYAITQDNVAYAQCNGTGPSTHNDVVRYITVGDSVALLPGTSSGTSANVTYNQSIRVSDPRFILKNMKLVAFLTESSTHDVVNAAILRKGFDTLQTPPKTLAIIDSSIDNHVFHPGDVAVVPFNSSNVLAATASYSLDNGLTWHPFADVASSPIVWTVPDSATTQGKFRLTEIPDGAPVYTEKGTFSIVPSPHSLTILHPTSLDTAYIGHPELIQWTRTGFDSVKLEYSLNGGGKWSTIIAETSDTIYQWLVPDTLTSQAQIRITPLGVTDLQPQVSAAFVIQGSPSSVASYEAESGFAISSIYPNPLEIGNTVIVKFTSRTSGLVTAEVLDLLGHVVTNAQHYYGGEGGALPVSVASLPNGNYILHLSDGEHSSSRRIEIMH